MYKLIEKWWDAFQKRIEELLDCLPQDQLPKLQREYFHLTDRCNFNCLYCDKLDGEDLDSEKAHQLVDVSADLGADAIVFSGGEISLLQNKGLFELIAHSNERNFRVFLGSNGFFNIRMLEKIISAKPYGINISLDTANSEVHDSLVGIDGSWDRIVRNISELSKQIPRVHIGTMVTNKNYQDLPSRLLRFSELFPRLTDVQLIPPRNAPEMYLTLDQIEEYYQSISDIDSGLLGRFPLSALKIHCLFGDDDQSKEKASRGIYCFDPNIPCRFTLQQLRFTTGNMVYTCGYLHRQFQEGEMTVDEFLTDPQEKFREIQRRILIQVPFSKQCEQACGPEISSFNNYVHEKF